MGKPDVLFPGADGTNLVGRRVGRYELLYEIASGGMAAVYLARARGASGFERIAAVKVPHPHLRKDEEFAPMFLDEARIAAKIHHPNVVPVLDFGEAGVLYLVMDYVEGNHLAALIRAAGKKGERLPPGITLRIIVDALTGLHVAHELKDNDGTPLHIVHRDTSPQNVLIGTDGVSRITDFGIARAEARATVTRDGQVKGKLSYIAPEQLAGEAVTRRADIFGMGVLLWEALVGQRLFRANSEAETVNLLLSGEIKKPSEFVPDLEPLDAIVLKALARHPEDRFATAAEFADALENTTLKVASSRQVAACVETLLGEALAKRREDVQKLLNSEAVFRSMLSPNGSDAGTSLSLDDISLPINRGHRGFQISLAVGLVVLAGIAFVALRGGHETTPTRTAAQNTVAQGDPPHTTQLGVTPTPIPALTPTVALNSPPDAGQGEAPGHPEMVPEHSARAPVTRPNASSSSTVGAPPTHHPRHHGHEFSPGMI